jgi:Mrp family chromosome partitioning ATPase
VRRRWKLVGAITLLTFAVAAITVLRAGHTYAATASILVSPVPQNDTPLLGLGAVQDSGDPARNVQTAAALVDSDQAAAATAAKLGKPWSSQAVENAVNVTPLGQSDVLSVTASGSSPQQATSLANDFATAAVKSRAAVVQRNISLQLTALEQRLDTLPSSGAASAEASTLSGQIEQLRAAKSTGGDPSLSASQPAQLPTSPSGASHALILLLALIGGFALASVAALGLEYFSGPVRDEEELNALFPVPVLAYVPRVRRRQQNPLSPWQFPPAAFEQIRMLRVQLGMTTQAPVIMVTSAGSGDGKTTLVAAMAAAFSETGQDVIVMDLDLRKPSLESVLEVDRKQLALDSANHRPAGAMVPIPKLPGVKLLPVPPVDRSTLDAFMRRLPLLLAQAQRAAGCVILDTSPVGEVSEALRIAPMCETVVFVARPRHTSRRKLVLSRDLLDRAGAPATGIVVVGAELEESSYGDYYHYANLEPSANAEPIEGDRQRARSRSADG